MTPTIRQQLRDVMQAVACKHGLAEADLYIRDRSAAVSVARWEAWAECRARGYSFPVIAALAGWDHTSVMHGVRKHGGAL